MKYSSHEKILFILIALSLFVTRMIMAAGHAFAGLAIIFGIYMAIRFKSILIISKEWKKYLLAYTLFILFLIPSIFTAHEPKQAVKAFLDFYIYKFAFFLLIPVLFKSKKYIFGILVTMFMALNIESIYAVHQIVNLSIERASGFRGTDVILMLGTMLLISSPTALFFLFDKDSPGWFRTISGLSFLTMTGGVIANLSRSILVLYPFSSILSCLSLIWRQKLYLLALIIGLVSGSYAAMHYYPDIIERLISITNTKTDYSNLGRLYVWQSAISMFKDHLYFGVGLNDFSHLYLQQYRLPQEEQFLHQPHNIYLTIASENGICGLIGLAIFILYFLYSFGKNAFLYRSKYDMVLFSIFLSYICLFGFIDFPLHFSEGMRWFWATMGSVYSLKELSKLKNNNS